LIEIEFVIFFFVKMELLMENSLHLKM